MGRIIDYTETYKGWDKDQCLIMQGRGRDILAIFKAVRPVYLKGKKGAFWYYVEYRWLSCNCENENDEAWACVSGSDWIYLRKNEVMRILNKKNVNLFEEFRLFS